MGIRTGVPDRPAGPIGCRTRVHGPTNNLRWVITGLPDVLRTKVTDGAEVLRDNPAMVCCTRYSLRGTAAPGDWAEFAMYIPAGRERVQIVDRQGVFLVLQVDHEQQSARVIALHGKAYFAEDVPFSLLRPYKMDAQPKAR